jgi:hypothetical protein
MLGYAQLMIGKPTQIVQPWWFGDDEDGPDNTTKATAWWLSPGLPKLVKTGSLTGKTARADVHKMGPTKDPEERRMARSKMTPGMATTAAKLWGDFVASRLNKDI